MNQWDMWGDIDKADRSLAISKHKDYSPFNIQATGEIGVVVRLADKIIRLANLYGLDMKTGELHPPAEPNHESIEDNLRDIRNYGRILEILRRGLWGK